METNRRGAENAEGRELGEEMNQLTGKVIGTAIEVHRVLGPGFLEEVYKEAIIIEFFRCGILHLVEKSVTVNYKGHEFGKGRLDFLVANCLIVELKAVQNLAPNHEAQVLSYLKMTNYPLALLINFNVPLLKDGIKRIILS
ncbi:GxxExxY protein [Nostoc sp. GT001]|uniref:GxxExxY protein n=1 Tax=Nostoc sp. GT001 TaxID=3056647 RepID=UPI0025AA4847|nr:GxxExxY protein [Nostoc sp. GT001]MDM9582822.1 GxxExxY protein [Nostoc sp. GT001]